MLNQDIRTRILIADDHPFVRAHYKRVLETQANFKVVGVAEDGQEAVAKASELAPDVVIIDVFMPKLDGIGAALQILKRRPETAIVMISGDDDLAFVKELIKGGPERKAFLLKDSVADIGGLIQAVVAVVNGQLVLDSNIVQKLARHYVNRALLDRLTSVERQVLMLLATGYEYSAIAELLDIDLRKVDGYADSIYAKLPKLSQGGHLPPRDQAILAFVNYGTSSPYEFV